MLDAEPIAANVERLRKELHNLIVIVSGFVGVNDDGDLTLLGRGGSDYTALFLAQQIGGHCVLVKDVAGLYEADPRRSISRPRRFASADFKTARAVGGEVVQPKAIRFAEKHNLNFSITAIGASVETVIHGGADEFAPAESANKPLRVALLGCGVVGGGVYQRLSELPELFTVTGVAVSHRDKARVPEIPDYLLTTNAAGLIEKPCDVVVELIGGTETAGKLITRALRLGRRVVTANKALFAAQVERFENLAAANDVGVRYGAAVGGAMPALETVSQARKFDNLRSVAGILNGTCNYICDELAKGNDFAAAVEASQKAGFAEANPELDLSGTDAAQKLILLARLAFGADLPLAAINREGIENLDVGRVQKAIEKGNVIRLVAECCRTTNGIEASVKPVELPASHPLAQTRGADNCLLLETVEGAVEIVRGTGAGRWATTEAVIADLLDARREIISAKQQTTTAKATAATAGKTEVYV